MNWLYVGCLCAVIVWSGIQLGWWLISFGTYRRHPDDLAPYLKGSVKTCVVIPAKNEGAVIRATVLAWLSSFTVCAVIVLDDGSTDDTAARAAAAGAWIMKVPREWSGKSGAVAWFSKSLEEHSDVVYVFADADNVPKSATVAERLALGARRYGVVQGDVRSRGGSWLQDVCAVERSASWAVLQAGRCACGGAAFLGGTGWAIESDLLRLVRMPTYSLCDDLTYAMVMASLGLHVVYLENVVVYESEPISWRQLWRQRVRWGRGTIQTMLGVDFGKALKGSEKGQAWFILISQAVMLFMSLSVLAVAVTNPEQFARAIMGVFVAGSVFSLAGVLRTGRVRGIFGYVLIWFLNIGAFLVALVTWRRRTWVPTIHTMEALNGR